MTLIAAACTGPTQERPLNQPRLEIVNCPTDVAAGILLEHRCGTLTVPEHRSKPAGRTIEVFVVIVEPPSDDASPDALLSFGGELGEIPQYSNLVAVAERVNRRVIFMEPRGAVRSEPSLVCPEVETAEREMLSMPTADPAYDQTFLAAVSACFERLLDEGVDPSAYNVVEMAADAEDLRLALGIEEWNVTAIGDASLIALELTRAFPDHIRSVILDSPVFPSDSGFATATEATIQALEEVDAACRAQPTCAASFPNVADAFDEAVARLNERPIRFTTTGEPPTEFVVDGGLFARLIRWYAAGVDGPSDGAGVPAMIYDGLSGRYFASFDLLANSTICIGYRATCNLGTWTPGLFFSVLCHERPPIVEPSTREGDRVGEALLHPYADLCRAWPVPTTAAPTQAIRSDVPTLILVGQTDPMVSRSSVEEAGAGLSRGFIVPVPGEGSNLLSAECPRNVRNLWIEEPIAPPDTTCVGDMRPRVFIAPIAHHADGGRSTIPDGTFEVTVGPDDGLRWGLDAASAASYSGKLRLALDDGRFRLHDPYADPIGPSPRKDGWIGEYRANRRAITFVVDQPFIFAGLSWTDDWQTKDGRLLLRDTEMSSREDALFFSAPEFLAVFSTWMESHPWRRVDRTR